MATCFRSIISGGFLGSSGQRMMKLFLSISAMMPSHQPHGSPSLSQYFPTTYEPTVSASRAEVALTGSGLAVANGAGGDEFLFCSEAGFVVVVAAAFSALDGSGAPAAVR